MFFTEAIVSTASPGKLMFFAHDVLLPNRRDIYFLKLLDCLQTWHTVNNVNCHCNPETQKYSMKFAIQKLHLKDCIFIESIVFIGHYFVEMIFSLLEISQFCKLYCILQHFCVHTIPSNLLLCISMDYNKNTTSLYFHLIFTIIIIF